MPPASGCSHSQATKYRLMSPAILSHITFLGSFLPLERGDRTLTCQFCRVSLPMLTSAATRSALSGVSWPELALGATSDLVRGPIGAPKPHGSDAALQFTEPDLGLARNPGPLPV